MDKEGVWSDESILQWFIHMEYDRVAKRVYVEDCVGSLSRSAMEKLDHTLKDCLNKKRL